MAVKRYSLRARIGALLERAGLQRLSFREELQRIVDEIAETREEESPEIRSAIRKGVPAEQWSTVLRVVLEFAPPL